MTLYMFFLIVVNVPAILFAEYSFPLKGSSMNTIQHIVVGSALADKVQLKLGSSHKLPNTKPFRFAPKAEDTLYKLPIIGFLAKKDMGSVRVATEDDVLSLVEKAKFFQKNHLLSYLNNVPQNELSNIELSFIFLAYDTDMKIAEHLSDMLSYLQNVRAGSHSGRIDYPALEKQFSKLIKNEAISTYIPQARKHSYMKVLNIRQNSMGGKKNEAS